MFVSIEFSGSRTESFPESGKDVRLKVSRGFEIDIVLGLREEWGA